MALRPEAAAHKNNSRVVGEAKGTHSGWFHLATELLKITFACELPTERVLLSLTGFSGRMFPVVKSSDVITGAKLAGAQV